MRDDHENWAQGADDSCRNIVESVEVNPKPSDHRVYRKGNHQDADPTEYLCNAIAIAHVASSYKADDEEVLQARGTVDQAEDSLGEAMEPEDVAVCESIKWFRKLMTNASLMSDR